MGTRKADSRTSICTIAALMLLVAPTSAMDADETATYELELNITWSAETNPLEFPLGAHLSSVIAATHNGRYTMFRDGDTASSGLELVAENGRTSIIKAEMAEAQRRDRLDAIVEAGALKEVPGQVTMMITAKKSHPLLSFVTMIAPSPDWFTGAADVSLIQDDTWIEHKEITLWVWDSGTDSGETYTAQNMGTQPQQSIRLVTTPHFFNETALVPFGRATLKRVRE
ncbi:spondin domain-containing protein [Hoeflea sp.]|uniref:spondin domain-containing protein n=1 Tax=Hoeflea sp. TaxID=1940281 RepID=UPI0037494480